MAISDNPVKTDKRTEKSRRLYRDALERLIQGIPNHPNLKEAVRTGKGYTISPTTVALEAGKSRNPLYTNHQDILAEIEAAVAGVSTKAERRSVRLGSTAEKIEDLQTQIRNLKADKARLSTQNLGLLIRVSAKEEIIVRLERDKARLTKRMNQVTGIHLSSDTVRD